MEYFSSCVVLETQIDLLKFRIAMHPLNVYYKNSRAIRIIQQTQFASNIVIFELFEDFYNSFIQQYYSISFHIFRHEQLA